MGTRCGVFYETKDKKFKGSAIHFDGYLRGVGATLAIHYASYEKISQLVDTSAYFSSLEKTKDETIAKIGKENLELHEDAPYMTLENDLSALLEECKKWDWEYVYVFVNGEWLYSSFYFREKFCEFKKLTLDDIKEE